MKLLDNPLDASGRFAAPALLRGGKFVGRKRTGDVAFGYRMPAGFPGDVNRTHPSPAITAERADPTNTPSGFGVPVLANSAAGTVRSILTTDTAITALFGVTVRPYPTQQANAVSAFGQQGFGAVVGAIAPNLIIDVLRSGFIMVPVVGSPNKDSAVFLWVAAPSGNHITGGFEVAASGVNTVALDPTRYRWNGGADANGVAELAFNI